MNPFLSANLEAPWAISLVEESGSPWNCCYRISLVWQWHEKMLNSSFPFQKLCKWGDLAGERIHLLSDNIARYVYLKVKQQKALPGWDPEVYIGSQFVSHLERSGAHYSLDYSLGSSFFYLELRNQVKACKKKYTCPECNFHLSLIRELCSHRAEYNLIKFLNSSFFLKKSGCYLPGKSSWPILIVGQRSVLWLAPRMTGSPAKKGEFIKHVSAHCLRSP